MAKSKSADKKPVPDVFRVESEEVLVEATGSKDRYLQQRLINQVFEALSMPKGLSELEITIRMKSAIALLQGIKPADELEGMLAAQMVAAHSAAMECLRRAMIPNQIYAARDQDLKHAAKLMTIYTRQIETLNKHRGKGQQKITIEHVNLELSGQTIVGNVEAGALQNGTNKGPVTEGEFETLPHNPGEVLDTTTEPKSKPKKAKVRTRRAKK